MSTPANALTDQNAPVTAPPSDASRGGALANILDGALSGAQKASKAIGQRLSNFAANSPRGQELRKQAFEQNMQTQQFQEQKQEKQQQLDLEQKREAREEESARSEEDLRKLQGIDASLKAHETLMHLQDASRERTASYKQHLQPFLEAVQATDPDAIKMKTNYGEMDAQEQDDLLAGRAVHIVTGSPLESEDPSLAVIDTTHFNEPLGSQSVVIPTKYEMNLKTGISEPVPGSERTFTGTNTLHEAFTAWSQAADQKFRLEQEFSAGQKRLEERAKVQHELAETAETQAKAKKELFEAGAGAGDPSLTGDAYLNTLPPVMKDMVSGLLHYQIKPTDLGRAQNRQVVIAAAIHADPNTGKPNAWSEAQYQERYTFLQDWGSTKTGAGATRDRMNTAVGHLDYLAQASKALDQSNLPILNRIANEIGVQMGKDPKIVYDAIARKAASEAAAAQKGGGTSPTDPEIEANFKTFSSDNGAAQRIGNIRAQFGLIQTPMNTLNDHFSSVMGGSPDAFGQPTLFARNQSIIDRWTGNPNAAPPVELLHKDGSLTRFKNGQEWQLQNGKAVYMGMTQ